MFAGKFARLSFAGSAVVLAALGAAAAPALAAKVEAEPNDQVTQATQADFAVQVTGKLQNTSDIDYFKFNMPASGKLKLTLSNSKTNNPIPIYAPLTAEGYDGSYKKISSVSVALNSWDSQSVTMKLEKGENYLKVYSPYGVSAINNLAYEIDTAFVPATTKITSATGFINGFSVSWNTVPYAASYQVRYSTNKKMASAKKEASNNASAFVYGLKAKKKYYVQVRSKGSLGGAWSPWSSKKSVKTK